MNMDRVDSCHVCGGSSFVTKPVLWPSLIDEWQLDRQEADYVDRQQGQTCSTCGSNMRSIALAKAISLAAGTSQTLADLVASPDATGLKLLEINQAGALTPFLSRLPGRALVEYPDVDMHALPFEAGSFDFVVHSDTLEHVPNPIHALGECRRVLRTGGALCFTVPIIVGRMTRDRTGLPPSFHGDPSVIRGDHLVQTEFGADAWTFLMRAGFSQVIMLAVSYPVAIAITALK